MPDRIIRAELLTSEAWLALKDSADRVCWLVLALNADTMGNQPGGPHRLVHLCRHTGIDTVEKAAKMVNELSDVDLIRVYQHAEKPYIHIPRFRQERRYLGTLWPLSPWTTNEEKELLKKKPHAIHRDARYGVDVGVGVEVPQKKGAPVDNSVGKWWATPESMTAKATAIGLKANPGETRDAFYKRIRAAIETAKSPKG
jgi:hypothetical protein